MKTPGLILCALLPSLFLLGCQSTNSTSPSSSAAPVVDSKLQKEIVVVLEQWHRAIADHDVETLDRIWADDYASINPSGQIVPKAEDLRLVQAPGLVFEQLRVQDVQIRHQTRSTVIVTSITIASGVYRQENFGGQFRNTVFFEKHLGHWQAVWAQSTEIPTTGP